MKYCVIVLLALLCLTATFVDQASAGPRCDCEKNYMAPCVPSADPGLNQTPQACSGVLESATVGRSVAGKIAHGVLKTALKPVKALSIFKPVRNGLKVATLRPARRTAKGLVLIFHRRNRC